MLFILILVMDSNSNDSQPMSVGSIISIPKNTFPSKPYKYEDPTNDLRSIDEIRKLIYN